MEHLVKVVCNLVVYDTVDQHSCKNFIHYSNNCAVQFKHYSWTLKNTYKTATSFLFGTPYFSHVDAVLAEPNATVNRCIKVQIVRLLAETFLVGYHCEAIIHIYVAKYISF